MDSIKSEIKDPLGAWQLDQPSPKAPSPKPLAPSDAPIPILSPVVSIAPLSSSSIDDDVINPFTQKPTRAKSIGSVEKIHTIGLSNVASLPQTFSSSLKCLFTAINAHDTEGVIEYGVKLLVTPLGMTNAVENLLALFLVRCTALTILTITSVVFGSIFIATEFILETNRLIRTISFREDLSIDATLKSLQKTDPRTGLPSIGLLKKSLEQLQRDYFELSDKEIKVCEARAQSKVDSFDLSNIPEGPKREQFKDEFYNLTLQTIKTTKLDGKKLVLGRRINPKSIDGIQKSLALFLNSKEAHFSSDLEYSTFIELGQSLLETIDQESRKMLIVHSIGMTAIYLGVLAFAFGSAALPLSLLLAIFGVQLLFQMARGNAERAFLDQNGYSWCIKNTLIPEFILKFFNKPKAIKATQMQELNPSDNSKKTKKDLMVGAINERPRKPHWSDPITSRFLSKEASW